MRRVPALVGIVAALAAGPVVAGDAPDWVHALVNQPTPAHDEKADAAILYDETVLSVATNGRIRRLKRMAIRILRPEGERWGVVQVNFAAQNPIKSLRGWCIPASGKDYQVKEKDAVESILPGVQNGELMSDTRAKFLRIPAALPGNLVAFEFEQEETPYFMDDVWDFQDNVPVAQARYTLQLPAGWTYKALWINHAEAAAVNTGPGQWQWNIGGEPAVAIERQMPPWRGVAARMVVALQPPGQSALLSWKDMGEWYLALLRDRVVPTPEIRQKVAELTAGAPDLLHKIQAIARFVQTDIRYVAIELGIGGHQPHAAADVFQHRYGDCKDKVALLSAMLSEIGIESHVALVNTVRGTIAPDTPPHLGFNHAIAAITLPATISDPSLLALSQDKTLGRMLFFDPTNELMPLGSLPGYLQGNYALLVRSGASELVLVPRLAPETNSMKRTAQVSLDEHGTMRGEFAEVYRGDMAAEERSLLRRAATESDQIKPVEARAAESLSSFAVRRTTAVNIEPGDRPFEWHYAIEADRYAKVSGDLMMVRPRIVGEWSTDLLETREPRRHPVEFGGPMLLSDNVSIELPPGFTVDELPPPLNVEFTFGTYRSSTEIRGNVMHFTRTLEIRQLSVPVAQALQLRDFYRDIAGDGRQAAVLKRVTP